MGPPTTTSPGWAEVCSRLAVLTTSPIAVIAPPARSAPTSTSPVLTPIRIRICGTVLMAIGSASGSSSASASTVAGAIAAMVCCMRNAARTARSASSSWAIGAPNRATMASPTILSTRPPNSAMSSTSRSNQPSTRFLTFSGSSGSAREV